MVVFPDTYGERPICDPGKCGSGDALESSPPSREDSREGAVAIEPTARTRYKDSMREALGSIVQSGAADQMRGYANQAMGKTKLTLGMATQSPNLTLSGLAQIVVGEFQKSIGEAKTTEDEKDIFPGL